MKKLVSCLLSATLSAAVLLSFAGCQWDAGGSNFTPSDEWIAAAAAYNAKVAEIETAVKNEAEYTKTSREAMKTAFEALPTFKTAGHTPEEIYAQIEALNALCEEKLVTPDQAIDERISTAITSLKLHLCYGDTYTNPTTGQISIPYPHNKTHPRGTLVYVKDVDGEPVTCEKDDEGAYLIADKGVDSIAYDNESNHAIFNLSKGSDIMLLIRFTDTGVLGIFDSQFKDLTEIRINVNVYKNAEATEKTNETIVMSAETASGMYLAAALLAVCSGYEQELFDMFILGNMTGFNDLIRTMKEKTYSLVAGKSCSAQVTFSNEEYTSTETFGLTFTNVPN